MSRGALPRILTIDGRARTTWERSSSNLEALLRARGIDTVIVAGTVTNVCCRESTARDAMMRNFRTIMVTRRERGDGAMSSTMRR